MTKYGYNADGQKVRLDEATDLWVPVVPRGSKSNDDGDNTTVAPEGETVKDEGDTTPRRAKEDK